MLQIITEKLDRAKAATVSGEADDAIALLSPLLERYPCYLAAKQQLAAAYEQRGDLERAAALWQSALASDPRDVDAYAGLGRIAEAASEQAPALAFHQVAWELQPSDAERRATVEQLARQLFAFDGRMQWTRAALANLQLQNDRLERAALEYQRALRELPSRADLRVGLLAAIWRLHDDDAAARLASQLLIDQPYLSEALMIMIDIAHRQGDDGRVEQHRQRLRELDPDGQLSRQFVERHPSAAQEALLLAPQEIPTDEQPEPAPLETAPAQPRMSIASSAFIVGEETLPAGFPDAPDIAPLHASPPATEPVPVTEDKDEPEAADEPVAILDRANLIIGRLVEAPSWPPEISEPPPPNLPSDDDLAAMLGVPRSRRDAEAEPDAS